MDMVKVTLVAREETGKEANGRLRRDGFVPVEVYGPGVESNVHAAVSTKAAESFLTGEFKDAKYEVTLPCGTVKTCSIKSATKNFSNDQLLHIDFYAE